MRLFARSVNLVLLLFLVVPSVLNAEIIEETLELPRADGSLIQVEIRRVNHDNPVPVLLAIDGSLCVPSMLGASFSHFVPGNVESNGYALVVVEKPSPTMPSEENGGYIIDQDFQCSDEFKRYYSIDQRLQDHLRVIQHLRSNAEWWDGRLLVWGFSDGGRIGARVGAFTPETERMVLGGFGGGVPMAQEFEDFHICREDRTDNRDGCLVELRAQFQEIRENPTSNKTWMGDANTWRTWASRLDAVEANFLIDTDMPILLFHGTEDQSVPVSSARRLVEKLNQASREDVSYHEIDGMGHGLGSGLGSEKAGALHRDFLSWLLSQ